MIRVGREEKETDRRGVGERGGGLRQEYEGRDSVLREEGKEEGCKSRWIPAQGRNDVSVRCTLTIEYPCGFLLRYGCD